MLKKRVLILTIISLMLMSTYVYAYVHFKGGYNSPSIRFSPDGLPSQYEYSLIQAAASWNATSTQAYISKDVSSKNKINIIDSYDRDTYGAYTPQAFDKHGQATQFNIWINKDAIVYATTQGKDFFNVAQSTFAHEFGHALHLNDQQSGTSIMNSFRDRNVIYTPQQVDINNVNSYTWP